MDDYKMFVMFLFMYSFPYSYIACPYKYEMLRKDYFDDLKIPNNSLWSEVTDSGSACASRCFWDEKCVSFFYNTQTEVCTAHDKVFNSTGPSIEDKGSLYYALPFVKGCADVLNRHPGSQDGVYTINPLDGKGHFRVYCDMTTDGGGWTVFQRRVDNATDFYRNWTEYRSGFGDVERNFWLGNDFIYRLSAKHDLQLRIDMRDLDDQSGYATYSHFKIENEAGNYRLHVNGFNGDRGDSLTSWHNDMMFTTIDRDNDNITYNCAERYGGAWWYSTCHTSNLNGIYGDTTFGKGLNWFTWHDRHYSLKWTDMKLKPI